MKTYPFATILTLLASSALAGPPMICHQIEISGAKSLPWGSGPNWDSKLPGHDTSKLAANTFELLTDDTPVLVRMETLRRAVIYAASTPELTKQLAGQLVDRAKRSQSGSLAYFDAGYFIEASHQHAMTGKPDPLAGMDGYSLAKKSLGARDVAAVEYGLALTRAFVSWPNDHYRNAVVGAQEGSLLAINLLHAADKKSLAELRAVVLARR